jgi:hypothetical protein
MVNSDQWLINTNHSSNVSLEKQFLLGEIGQSGLKVQKLINFHPSRENML